MTVRVPRGASLALVSLLSMACTEFPAPAQLDGGADRGPPDGGAFDASRASDATPDAPPPDGPPADAA